MDINKLIADDLAKNYQINAFTKGMNSDTAYDSMDSALYLFGLNVRVTNNALFGEDPDANNKESLLSPIPFGKDIEIRRYNCSENSIGEEEAKTTITDPIVASDTIGNIGVVIIDTHNESRKWHVYKTVFDAASGILNMYLLYAPTEKLEQRPSIVLYKETEGVIKLYIADGQGTPMMLFVDNYLEYNSNTYDDYTKAKKLFNNNDGVHPDQLRALSYFPSTKPWLLKISGNLKTQQVQYTYRFYKRFGNTSKLSPLTNKILIIDNSRTAETGNAEDTTTNVGMRISIVDSGDIDEEITKRFDRMLIFRISYISYGKEPTISLIYDGNISKTYDDSGGLSLKDYTIEEFSALTTQTIYPNYIEDNQRYLFYGNCKDASILEDDDVSCANATFTQHPYVLELTIPLDQVPELYKLPTTQEQNDADISDYLKLLHIETGDTAYDQSYNNIFVSSLCRSLMPKEKYAYGVVYYSADGRHSKVKALEEKEVNLDNAFYYNTDELTLSAKPIGAHIKITVPKTNKDIVGFEIVRCEKGFNFSETLLQVALSRPLHQSKYSESDDNKNTYRTPYYPNMFISTSFFAYSYSKPVSYSLPGDWQEDKKRWLWFSDDSETDPPVGYFDYNGTNADNMTVVQLFAPEINIKRNDTLSTINVGTYLSPVYFVCVNGSNYHEDELVDVNESIYTANNIVPPEERLKAFVVFDSNVVGGIHNVYVQTMDSNTTINKIRANVLHDEDYQDWPYGMFILRIQALNNATYYYDDYIESSASGLPDANTKELGFILMVKKDLSHDSKLTRYKVVESDAENPSTGRPFHEWQYMEDTIIQDGLNNKSEKLQKNVLIKLRNFTNLTMPTERIKIKSVADVKNPSWMDGWSDVKLDGKTVKTAIKKYKSYYTSVGTSQYVNWVAGGIYDCAAGIDDVSIQNGNNLGITVLDITGDKETDWPSTSWQGPGPLCLLANTEFAENGFLARDSVIYSNGYFGTHIANITHNRLNYPDNGRVYYGFGNYYSIKETDSSSSSDVNHICEVTVYDGEHYPTLAEFTSMFKTYEFSELRYNVPSSQVVYYIPLMSRINTYFDYGMNYRNTQSANLMLEPGSITGVISQDRPLHQYNMIYSYNDWSINSYVYNTSEIDLSNEYPQRIYYSLQKTNGEPIDSWLITKPIDFLDADSEYGPLTNLYADKNTLFIWQKQAFGKIDVNERQLVTSDSGEAIQLGLGGVLSRVDYMSTEYGMLDRDFSSISAGNGIFWIDRTNRAVLQYALGNVQNYGELLNVQSFLNKNIDTTLNNRPCIDYDLQTNELLCKCLSDGEFVFNIKFNIAVGKYIRSYLKILEFDNTLVGITKPDGNAVLYNNLNEVGESGYLKPTVIDFVVNGLPKSSSTTKVFDSQKVVVAKKTYDRPDNNAKKEHYLNLDYQHGLENVHVHEYSDFGINYFKNRSYEFETDIRDAVNIPKDNPGYWLHSGITEREGNILYSIPRTSVLQNTIDNKIVDTSYGNRMRGKWMKERIEDDDPKLDYCISHIITKFRQSYS